LTRLLGVLEIDPAELPPQSDSSGWPLIRSRFTDAFLRRTAAEWVERAAGADACLTPVVPLSRVAEHPHLVARRTFTDVGGVTQPAPAPRFSRTPARIRKAPPPIGGHDDALESWGLGPGAISALRESGAIPSLRMDSAAEFP
jgi:alpha-methylacyl-CoA racemase